MGSIWARPQSTDTFLFLENSIAHLTGKELEILLRWKGFSVSEMGNISNRQVLYQQFAEGGVEETSIPALWTEQNRTT